MQRKGEALKTGFRYILEERANISAVLTMDGDGQHQVSDVANFETSYRRNKNTIYVGWKTEDKGYGYAIYKAFNQYLHVVYYLFLFWPMDT